MRYTPDEKYEIIRLVEDSELGVGRTLQRLGIHKSTFYSWYNRYLKDGMPGLYPKIRAARTQWNRIPDQQRQQVVETALELPDRSPRELACIITDEQKWFISESSVYRILKQRGLITSPTHILMSASSEFKDKTTRVHQMWQTDFTYFKIINWGWYYLSTVLDDYSRYIIHWELCSSMKKDDAQRSVQMAMDKTGLTKHNAPKLLSDNGPCYIAQAMKEWTASIGIEQVHGRPNHPQTQGKIERYHRTMKNVVKLENYYSPSELQHRIKDFVTHYNNHRYHESLGNVKPIDVYLGRQKEIFRQRRIIKQKTLKKRRLINQLKLSKVSLNFDSI